MLFRETTSVYSEGHIINIQLQCVWQNGEFRNDAATGIYLAPGFQWLTNQQQSFYMRFYITAIFSGYIIHDGPTRKMLPLITAVQIKQNIQHVMSPPPRPIHQGQLTGGST